MIDNGVIWDVIVAIFNTNVLTIASIVTFSVLGYYITKKYINKKYVILGVILGLILGYFLGLYIISPIIKHFIFQVINVNNLLFGNL